MSTIAPHGAFFFYNKDMSTLHHESLLETCFDEAWDSFRASNKLSLTEMEELWDISRGTRDAIERSARKLFTEACR